MSSLRSTGLMRIALLADAAASGAVGLLLAGLSGTLASLFGLPDMLLLAAGILLLPYAGIVAWIGCREQVARRALWAIIGANVLWSADSLVLLVSGWVAPTGFGYAFVLLQAAVVLIFAELQYVGMRRVAASRGATARLAMT